MTKCEKCGVEYAEGQEHKCETHEQPSEQAPEQKSEQQPEAAA